MNTNPTYKPRDTEKSSQEHDEKFGTLVRRPKRNYQSSRKGPRRTTQPTASQLNETVLPPTIESPQIIADQFLSNFITFFARVSPRQVLFNSWMTSLPDMLAARSIAVEKSIIAASMVFAGRDSGNTSIVVESYKWYGAGIAQQRKLLEDLQREKRVPTVEEICTPILLSFFEITCNTSPTGYFQHLMGAARLLEMRGPEDCSSGILHQLFLTVRIQLIHPAIVWRMPSIFASEAWLTIPFQGRPKSVFDRVIDAITIISSIESRLDETRSAKHSSEAELQLLLLRGEATKIKEQLDQWWDEELREASQTNGWNGDHYRGVPGFDFDYDCLNSEQTFTDDRMTVRYPDNSGRSGYSMAPPTGPVVRFYAESRATAFYNTARILTLSILNELDARPARFEEQMQAHSESILSVARFLTGMDIGYAYVRLLLPLTLVARLSPLETQKIRAREVMSEWRMKGGVAGLCEVVLSDIQGEAFRAQL